jgi:hypothetical protein
MLLPTLDSAKVAFSLLIPKMRDREFLIHYLSPAAYNFLIGRLGQTRSNAIRTTRLHN